jgi:hypothetical protein
MVVIIHMDTQSANRLFSAFFFPAGACTKIKALYSRSHNQDGGSTKLSGIEGNGLASDWNC